MRKRPVHIFLNSTNPALPLNSMFMFKRFYDYQIITEKKNYFYFSFFHFCYSLPVFSTFSHRRWKKKHFYRQNPIPAKLRKISRNFSRHNFEFETNFTRLKQCQETHTHRLFLLNTYGRRFWWFLFMDVRRFLFSYNSRWLYNFR